MGPAGISPYHELDWAACLAESLALADNSFLPRGNDGMSRPDYAIAVLAKALNLLDLLEEHQPQSLTELSRRSGIHKATAYRILANLENRGYVERDDSVGPYRLGFHLMRLGMRVTAGLDLPAVARPILERLQSEFNETVNLAVPGERGVVYIEILESAQGLRMAATVGAQDPFHSTALGKAMLAFWPASRLDEFLESTPLTARTTSTIVQAGTLKSELRRIRLRGYAVDNEENEPGARCVAAPIFDRTGSVIAAVSISGPASRLKPTHITGMTGSVMSACRQISIRLGYVPADTQLEADGKARRKRRAS